LKNKKGENKMTKKQIKAGAASLFMGVLAPVALMVPSVSAASIVWTGAGDNAFNNTANWTGGVVPGASDSAVFTTASIVQSITNSGAITLDKIVFSGAVTGTSSKSYTIEGGDFTLSGIDAIMTGSGGDHQIKSNVTLGADATFKTTGSNTLSIGDGVSAGGKGGGGLVYTIDLGSNDLTLQPDGGTISLIGEIAGSGNIVISGTGKINMLAKKATGFSGGVTVTGGEFQVTEYTDSNVVINGGTLKGIGSSLGTVTMSAGSIEPGMSPGCIGMGNLTLTGGTFAVELNGNTACTQYDQVSVTGTVDLGSATTLDVSRLSSFAPAVNDTFSIILNDGTDAVQGTFVDRANGSRFTVDGYTYQINYDAGDGNDVLLLVVGTPSAPDTGVGSLLTSPVATLAALFAALTVVGGLKFAETKRR
jgi:hypothetical protein